ncbi:WD40 repeat domain-containing protein [Chloropicon primus]|uniref:WD40 repeat domain-containing protein n=2 Tax=Chloropicon primus TaxID=1764295 RepID=A0A5B8MVB9_9CHLO|nr:WD40 repeat domain-containing protein [Chloropicon primus]UPR03731.1 WD40 repeat domain-containing protein [Chloropicon primus]|eukprot:QDZ24523.1 WD40 repeat domain-containing protein [Chloropicon primus]
MKMKQATLLSFFKRSGEGAAVVRKAFDAMYDDACTNKPGGENGRHLEVVEPAGGHLRKEASQTEEQRGTRKPLQAVASKPVASVAGNGLEGGEEESIPTEEESGLGKENGSGARKVGGGEKSEYEQLRSERMAKNREALLRLVGSKSCSSLVGEKPEVRAKKPKRTPVARPKGNQESVRRSRRVARQGPEDGQGAHQAAGESSVAVPESAFEETLDFAPTAVADYSCASASDDAGGLGFDSSAGGGRASRLQVLSSSRATTSFRRVYSMDFDGRGALAVAGEKGLASVLGLEYSEDGKPSLRTLLDCKLSRSWIASVQFVGKGGDRLLSASNDGEINLWNLGLSAWDSKMSACVPSNVCSHQAHSKGIFSMDAAAGKILTGSKDSSVGLSVLSTDSIRTISYFDDLHSSVVKSVAFRGGRENEFASAGNDRVIRLCDLRSTPSASSGSIEDAHNSAINTLQFSPDGMLLLSSSFDPQIKVWDVRKITSVPLFELQGHLPTRSKSIQSPVFTAGGTRVVATGEKTDLLTLYDCTTTGKLVSHGAMDFMPSKLHSVQTADKQFLVAAGQGDLALLRPSQPP